MYSDRSLIIRNKIASARAFIFLLWSDSETRSNSVPVCDLQGLTLSILMSDTFDVILRTTSLKVIFALDATVIATVISALSTVRLIAPV